MRLGPFPSARDAMKFAAYASVGAIVVPWGGAVAWLPILAAGFLLSVVRPDGKGLDERAGDYLKWRFRREATGPRLGRTARPAASDAIVRLPGGYAGAVVEAGGVPIRFLPPSDARALFERYGTLLRSLDAGFHLEMGARPVPQGTVRPMTGPTAGRAEASARAGYEEFLRLVLKRRRLRRVRVLLFEPLSGAVSLGRLEARVRTLVAGLDGMGVGSDRLRGQGLLRALEAMGWPSEGRP